MNDIDLVHQIQESGSSGLEKLMELYGPLVRYVVCAILPSPEDTEECCSDVFLKIWRSIGTFDPRKGSLRSWISAVSRNTAINFARKNAKEEPFPEEEVESACASEDVEDSLLRRERLEHLKIAVGTLTKTEKILFYRKYYYMQSAAQIASECMMSVKAVENRLYRIRQKIRKRMEETYHE